MCRLSAITSDSYFSPMENILALETMKEGHDGSGLGLVLKGLGGEFEDLKEYPVFSGICSRRGLENLNEYMKAQGFEELHHWEPKIRLLPGFETRVRDHYVVKAYNYPEAYRYMPMEEKEELLMQTRLALRSIGERDESIFAFSFYPDVITLKEVGDPLQLGEYLGLDRDDLKAKIIFAQGRQNTNYTIYAANLRVAD
jgi:hypothetical protein